MGKELKVKSGYAEGVVYIGIESEGEITGQIAFPVGMESLVAEAVLASARSARETKSRIIKPEMKLTKGVKS